MSSRPKTIGERADARARAEAQGKGGTPPDELPDLLKIAGPDDVAGIEHLKATGAALSWVWPGWIQRGVITLIAAEGGTGKTRLAADLVRRVRHGLPWPDGPDRAGHDGKTAALWVVADNHHGEMVSLCEGFDIAGAVKVNSHPADPFGGVVLDGAEDFAVLERRVEVTRPLFVVVDTVGNATDKNLSRQEEAKGFYQPLQILARRQKVAVLCLTHLNAAGSVLGRRGLEKVRTAIRMTAQDPGDPACRRRLEVVKSNSPYPKPLGVTMGTAGNQYDTDPPPPDRDGGGGIDQGGRPATAANAVKEWLSGFLLTGPQTVATIREQAEARGISAATLYRAKALLKIGDFERNGIKCWGAREADEGPEIPD